MDFLNVYRKLVTGWVASAPLPDCNFDSSPRENTINDSVSTPRDLGDAEERIAEHFIPRPRGW